MKLDAQLENKLEELINQIQDSETYASFEASKKAAMRDMNLKNAINRTRVIREQLDKMSTYEKSGDACENLLEEYDKLVDITAVHKFSVAEHEFCEMYQIIMSRIADIFDMEL